MTAQLSRLILYLHLTKYLLYYVSSLITPSEHLSCRSGGTVDALRSERSALTGVWVQIPPSAETKNDGEPTWTVRCDS